MRGFAFKEDLLRRQYLSYSSASFLLVLALWCLLSYGHFIDSFFLPTPSTIAITIYDLFKNQDLIRDILASVSRIILAFSLSAILAIPLGILLSVFSPLEALVEPAIDFIRYLPVPALVPLTILWVGIGESSKILLLFIGTFFQLVLLIMDDANNVPKEYFEAAYTLGAGTKDILLRVLLPAVLPHAYDDLRITLGWCWTYLLIAEIVASQTGIGHLIQEAQRFAKPDVVISGVLIIGVIGILTDYAFKLGGKIFFRYRQP